MAPTERSLDDILRALQERAKELNCLYRVDEILSRTGRRLEQRAPRARPDRAPRLAVPRRLCGSYRPRRPRLRASRTSRRPPGHSMPTSSFEGETVGEIAVYYTERMPHADEGPFLQEERRLINAIAERVGYLLLQRQLRRARPARGRRTPRATGAADRWGVILDFLRTDRSNAASQDLPQDDQPPLLERRRGGRAAAPGVRAGGPARGGGGAPGQPTTDPGAPPRPRHPGRRRPSRSRRKHLSEEEILSCIQTWIKEDKASFLIVGPREPRHAAPAIADAVRALPLAVRHRGRAPDGGPGRPPGRPGAALLHRPARLPQQRQGLRHVEDFHDLVRRIVFPPRSHGKLGGKSAGLFLASRIVARSPEYQNVLSEIKVPKTWYVTSDGLLDFIQLQRPRGRLRPEVQGDRPDPPRVPAIVQLFKNSQLPPGDGQGPVGGPRRLRGPAAHRAQLEPARGPRRVGVLRQVQEPVPRQPGDASRSAWRRCWTPSPRSTRRSSAPTRSSTAPSAACSTSTRRWAS